MTTLTLVLMAAMFVAGVLVGYILGVTLEHRYTMPMPQEQLPHMVTMTTAPWPTTVIFDFELVEDFENEQEEKGG